jgi:hypothetical protein
MPVPPEQLRLLADQHTRLTKAPRGPEFDAALRDAVKALVQCLLHPDPPDCTATFNELLRGLGCFTLFPNEFPAPLDFTGNEEDAHKAFCTASVFRGLADCEGGTQGKPQLHRLGWPILNLDAKGWSRALLLCDIPARLPPAAQTDLLAGKWEILRIVRDTPLPLALSVVPIDPLIQITASQTLDVPVDD